MSNQWQQFTGEYEKQFYEVTTDQGGGPFRHCWPNAGEMWATDGSGRHFGTAFPVWVRRCTCGHFMCLPPEPERCKHTADMFGGEK